MVSAESQIVSHLAAYRERNGRSAPVIVLSHDLYFDWLIETGKPDRNGEMYGTPFAVEGNWPGRVVVTPLPQA